MSLGLQKELMAGCMLVWAALAEEGMLLGDGLNRLEALSGDYSEDSGA